MTFGCIALALFLVTVSVAGCARPEPAEDQLWKIMKHHYDAR